MTVVFASILLLHFASRFVLLRWLERHADVEPSRFMVGTLREQSLIWSALASRSFWQRSPTASRLAGSVYALTILLMLGLLVSQLV